MTENKADEFNWRLPVWGALGAVTLLLPLLIFGNDAVAIFGSIPLAVLIGVILFAIALSQVRRHGLAVFTMICIFLVVAWSLFQSSDFLRTTTRWLVHSQSYKAQLLSEHVPSDGSLQHIEWDGWGFAGAGNTVVYLVFDPNDRLGLAAQSHSSGAFSGIPCEVVKVHRLERNWYTVLFYTDTAWNDCGSARPVPPR